jgi:CRP/FNR family transcriptional regulator, cyclic AMP receptor protein
VSAVEDGDGLLVAGPAFLDYLERHPRVCLALMRTLSGRLREADRKHVEFAASDTVGRVARRLLDLSAPLGHRSADGLHVALPVSQDELASWVGASREAVSKALRVMRTRGWIQVRRRDVVLLDEPALRRRAT